MSEFKLVSPLLDGFVMGDPISSHDGISCCPAMRENSNEKYIVKIISVPASQKQLDALLLTGAYPDAASATDYFKEVAEDISKEAALLSQLAKLEGFLGFEDWQIVPMEGSRLGYQVYLISTYKRSLEKYLRRNTMTRLGAVNLALDLCAALSICRRAGYVHMDLHPNNIFLTEDREFRIGDLGFAKLNALKYTSLPSKYCTCYTPPELHDAMATLNPTIDIYAVGMILYQIYNNGVLPFDDEAPATALPAPLNADYELAEIILKACDPNPRNRWQTPIEMGQALADYLQRNEIQDEPLVPPAVEPDFLDAAYEPAAETEAEEELPAPEDPAAAIENGQLNFLEAMTTDETVPDGDHSDPLPEADVSEDVSSILSLADELMAAPVPEIPAEPAVEEETAPSEVPARETEAEIDIPEFVAQPAAPKKPRKPMEDDPFAPYEEPRKKRSILKTLIALLLVAAIGSGGFYFYQNYYLLNIEKMVISSQEDHITVELTTDVDDSLLQIVCTDTYGNALTAPVADSKVVFTDVNPGTLYKIEVTAEGFHSLSGSYIGTVTTVEQTKILEFLGKTGTEDGSVVLNFTVEGPEEDWILEYSAEGEDTLSMTFTGHMVTVNNLTVGKTYTFSLVTAPGSELYVVGTDKLEYTASSIVIAEDLSVVSCLDGVLKVVWNAPEGAATESWTVRCYSENGYDETVTVSDTSAEFSGISPEAAYTIEVTAAGMTQNARTYVSTNPVTISQITADDSTPGTLVINWDSNGVIPEGGWLLMYKVGDTDSDLVVRCAENTATIENIVPGSDYHLSVQAANGSSVFGGTYTYLGMGAESFKAHGLDASKISASLCPTPEKEDWTYEDISDGQYTANHTVGSKVSMVIYSPDKADGSAREVGIMYVIRDSEGNVLPELVKTTKMPWNRLWKDKGRYCELDLPIIPSVPGQYTVEIYFDRCLAVVKTLNVIE